MRGLTLLILVVATACSRDQARHEAPAPSTAAQATTPFPLTVRDDSGHTITVPSEPHRIVALLPSHTETLFALDLGDRVVGVDDNSDFPAAAKALPRLGALYDPRIESIVALKPDLVLVKETGPAADRLSSLGLTVWAGSATRLEDVYRLVESIATITGHRDRGEALARRMRADMDAEEARLKDLPRVRVYDELDPTPYTVGPESFLGVLLAKAGGDNIVPPGLGDFPRISPELVLARDPEVILGVTLEDAAKRPGWSAVSAVKRGAVEVLSAEERSVVSRSGPRLAEGLAVLGRHLHEPR